ncbi:hypothetical protein Pyrfu_1533 [Pyrolobus fumarii 1A]|uniref:Uncharacterized protein n=1 Tax=Pyrolobus fumarii (strain DSM 11204 / 1A) TaxID=694429 RepID=G0EHN7_PYRF1|nr:hypothetical protein [Pyrolobus fumarii]AEM39390.1 hypothetical protein Pyrfu_1533 [Pyrolobus fumarii 1A]
MQSSGSMVSECSICRLYEIAVEVSKPKRGVKPGFDPEHVIGYILLAARGPIGRPLAAKALGIGDTAAKTMIRRLREIGVIETRGREGSSLKQELRQIVENIHFCQNGNCIGINICGIDVCEASRGLSKVLELRDSLVSRGVTPLLILCCSSGFVAPGAPHDVVDGLISSCLECEGRDICVVLGGDIGLVEVSRVILAIAKVVC